MQTRRLLFLLIFFLVSALLISCLIRWKSWKHVRDLPEIKICNTLNVVTEYNSVDFYVDDDSTAGFQYELCRFISDRSGIPVHLFTENNLETAIRKLENNDYDVIAQSIPITKKTKQSLAFTIPITQNKQVLVQRKRAGADSVSFIANQLGLADQTIYVTKNAPAILRLNNLAEEIAEPIYVKEIADCTSEQLIDRVAAKEIDYAVVDKEIALKNADAFPELDFSLDISFTQLQAWALRKTSPILLDSLNVWITAFKENTQGKRLPGKR